MLVQETPKIQIRKAVNLDFDAIARIQARTMVASDHYVNSLDEEAEFQRLFPRVTGYFERTHNPGYSLAARAIYLVVHKKQIIGFVAGHCSTRMKCTAELPWIFVLPQWQRKGVGTSLLQPLKQWFQKHKSTKVIVDAPPEER